MWNRYTYTYSQCSNSFLGTGNTFSSAEPTKRIDYHLLYPSNNSLYCKTADTIDSQASDHLPLVVTYASHK